MSSENFYDVIVVGGGHAGTEAAAASARMGKRTLLLTHNIDTLGLMSCNPAIGGVGKGHLVREVDALGGIMGVAADQAGIHFRTLNDSKGAAVRATRAQMDRQYYRQVVRSALENIQGLHIFQQAAESLVLRNGQVCGVRTQCRIEFKCNALVLTAGTFLTGKIHVGLVAYEGGRAGEPPSVGLSTSLRSEGLSLARLKTGTPPRLDRRTLDFGCFTEQPSDMPRPRFSFVRVERVAPAEASCWITRTTQRTHDIIRGALHESPLYAGVIEGVGPRYCPSIEDKVVRFADKDSHQVFVEPEGLHTNEIYPNGISTSLPYHVQTELVRSIVGFERAEITRPGYAIEYDYQDPRHLKRSLESREISGLFVAGQLNGTTGYEEAAAQGLLAGVNAALHGEQEPWVPLRNEAYLGVMVDDLVSKGVTEPYRMFTSRAEYRLWLREDNADRRLTQKARQLGLVGDMRWAVFEQKLEAIEREGAFLRATSFNPKHNPSLAAVLGVDQAVPLLDIMKRPQIDLNAARSIVELAERWSHIEDEVLQALEIDIKYEGYLKRQQQEIARLELYESLKLPDDMNYDTIPGLSTEVRQRLTKERPATLGMASRMSGMTPSAVSILLVYLRRAENQT